ncbi:MAG: hypothetical protein ABW090_01205 [Sedimenticola sp.]
MISKKKVIWVLIVWIVGISALLLSNPPVIERADIQTKKGVVSGAKCVEGRSVWGVKFIASYDQGATSEDYFSLSSDALCTEELLEELRSSGVMIHYFGNRYLGIESGNMVIRSVEEELKRQDRSLGLVFFVLAICLIVSIAILFRGTKTK